MANDRAITARPVLIATGVLALTVWGLVIMPSTRLVGANRVYAATIMSTSSDDSPSSWDMDLRLDPAVRPPGPAWSLHEGSRPGQGYELRWLPDLRVLQVHRALPTPALLGSVALDRLPARLTFARRGGELTVVADGRLRLRCLDPTPQPPAPSERSWGALCTTGGDLRDSLLTVQRAPLATPRWGSDGNPGTGDEDGLRHRSDHCFLRVRAALAAVASRSPQAQAALGRAAAALGVGRTDRAGLAGGLAGVTERDRIRTTSVDDRVRLGQWVALARAEWYLTRSEAHSRVGDDVAGRGNDTDPWLSSIGQAREAITDLMDLGQASGNPEYAGMLLGLMHRLAAAATDTPRRSEAPGRVAERRRHWLDLLATVTEASLAAAGPVLGEDDRRLLALIRQACATRGGRAAVRDPAPLPVDAPAWQAVRWRLLAGDPPLAEDLPPLPAGSSGLAPAVDRLLGPVGDLALVEAAALTRRDLAARSARLLLAHEGKDQVRRHEDDAASRWEDPRLPVADQAVGLALVALHLGASRPGLLKLAFDRVHPATSDPAVRLDPLAFTCFRLLFVRFPDLRTGLSVDEMQALLTPSAQFEHLGLLSGEAGTEERIWLSRLPPAESLAIVLGAQEVAVALEDLQDLPERRASPPDWSLLEEVPDLGLPLRLLMPRPARAPGQLDAP